MIDTSLLNSAQANNLYESSSDEEKTPQISVLIPRDYQNEALQFAKSRNSIVFLDTGAGKTLIAILMIQHLFSSTWVVKQERKKLCIFLVTTVNLVDQQAQAIRRHSNVNVKTLHGDQSGEARFDQACPQNWKQYISQADVVVSIAQKFLFLLRHGFLSIQDIDLLIFDECHHCASNHPYALIMTQFYHRTAIKPRILGLTASPVKGKVNRAHSQKVMEAQTFHIMRSLSRLLDAQYSPLLTYEKVARSLPSPQLVLYDSATDPHTNSQTQLLEKILPSFFHHTLKQFNYTKVIEKFGFSTQEKAFEAFLKEFLSFYSNTMSSVGLQTKSFRDNSRNSNLRLDFLQEDDQIVLVFLLVLIKKSMPLIKELGVGAFILFSSELLKNFKKQAAYVCTQLEGFLKDAIQICNTSISKGHFYNSKVETLLKLLLQLNKQPNPQKVKSNFRGLIFVSERICGYYLSAIIEKNSSCRKACIRPRFVSGSNAPGLFSSITKGDLDDIEGILNIRNRLAGSAIARVILKEQRKIIQDFQNAECNLLIATSVVEEGLDVQACNVAICFNFFSSVKSYIQMRGRARKDDSKFLLLTPQDRQGEYLREIKESQECVKLMRKYRERASEQNQQDTKSLAIPQNAYLELPSKALLTLSSAPDIVKQYCIDRAQVAKVPIEEPRVKVYSRQLGGKVVGFLAGLTMPSFCNECVQTKKLESSEMCSSKEEAKNKLYYRVALILLEKGQLSPHLFWTNRPIRKNRGNRKLNYKGAQFYLRIRLHTLGLPNPTHDSKFYFYLIEPDKPFPFKNVNRYLGLALTGQLNQKVCQLNHKITRKAIKRLDTIQKFGRNLSTQDKFELSPSGMRIIQQYHSHFKESVSFPIQLKQFHKMTLNRKTRDLIHFFQTYLFYSLIGANLLFYKLILSQIVQDKQNYLTRIFKPILSLKSAHSFLK